MEQVEIQSAVYMVKDCLVEPLEDSMSQLKMYENL